jgi:nicotinamidase-related amidase
MTQATDRHSAFYEWLTPDNAAVLLIDHQLQLIIGCQSMEPKLLINNTLALGQIAKIFNLPVVITTSGSQGPAGSTIPQLVEMFRGHEIIDRTLYFNSMADPRFANAVKNTGRKKLIVAGITTDLCVVFPAISAVAAGYNVHVVVDACASWDKRIDDAAMMRMSQAGCILTNVQAVAAELQSSLAERDPEAAKQNQGAIFDFYTKYVGPTGMITEYWQARAIQSSHAVGAPL